VPSALHEILAPILADLAVNKVETGSFFGDADESKAAQEELQRRGINYSYGGDSTLGSLLLPLRREVISPERDRQIGEPYLNEKGQVTYQVQNIPAEYGKAEFGMEYIPVVRGARSVRSAARDFFLGDAKEQASVARSALNMVEGFGQHIAEQVQAFGSGGRYYDPKQERIVEADPTLVMFGGNPATTTGKVLGSGVRLPSGGKKRAYEQYGGNLEDARNKLNLTDEYRKEWQKTRSGFKQERPEELKIAAQKVSDGEMTFEEYRALVQEVLPPEPLGQLMEIPTLEEIALSLDKSPDRTAGIIGLNIDIPDGTPASSRLDISAYEDQGTWVNTIHEGGKKSGTVLGYGPTTVLNNVSFSSNPKQALEIAKGQGKTPIARIDGTWENRDPKIVEQQVRSILDGTAPDAGDWVEVGMNPIRGSGFYNKATFELVDNAEQILQVGPLVLAKKVKYRKPNDPKNQVEDRGVPRLDDQGDPIFFSGGGSTGNRIAGASALSNVERLRRAEEQGFGDVLYHATAPKEPIDQFKAKYPDGLNFLTTSPEFANRWLGKGGSRYNDADPELQRILKKDLAEIDKRYEERLGSIEGPDGENILSWPEKEQENYFRETRLAREAISRTNQSIYPVRTNVQNTFDPRRDTDVLEELMRLEKVDPDSNTLNSGMTNRQTYQTGNYLLYENKNVVDFLKSKGYDSMRLAEDGHAGGDFETLAVFDPKNIRSVNAQFDPQQRESANILYSGGGNTGNRIATASALRDITGDTPEVTRDTTLLERVLDVDSVNNMNPVWGEPELRSVPIARASDLEDRAYMTGITDTTDSSLRNLISLDGVPIDEKMRGGTFFGFQPEQMELGQAFASADGAIQSQINRARKAQQLSGREGVIFAPHGMTPSSPDFATMPTNIAVKYSRAMMEPKDKKLLDERIRNGVLTKKGDKYAAGKEPIPDWMGIDNVTDEYLASIGGKRKNVTRALDEFREAGALNLSQSRALVTDPSQFNKDWGMVNSMYLLDPKSGQTKPRSTHPSYPAALTGVPIGATTEGFSILDWNPTYKNNLNFIDEMMRKGREAGQEYIDIKKLDDGTVGFQRDKIQPKIQNIKRFDIPNRERPVIGGRARTAGSGLAGSLKSGGQGLITREMIDDLIARGLILSD
jgi:hypothetical protein